MEKEVKTTTSIKIEPELWKKVKIHCIKEGIDISNFLQNLIEKDLKTKKIINFKEKTWKKA